MKKTEKGATKKVAAKKVLDKGKTVTKGKTAVVNYTGKLENGQIFDSSLGRDPFQFTIGANQVIPAFESCVLGQSVGYKTTVNIKAESAYGLVREDLIVKVPLENIPAGVQVGQTLHAAAEGQEIAVIVKEINSDHVLIDGNHPLAGKSLTFDIEIIDIIN
jgi:FKBP-type peptidyl-prolyl cis-trans isomerase 2